jgi:polysaccharide pyruvyl transferase WcaK-like protein
VIGGGTFVPKYPEHPDLAELARRLPCIMFGTGIGDPFFWGRDHIATWLDVIAQCRFVGVRGPLSRRRLIEWGVPGNRIEVVGDCALRLAEPATGPAFVPRTLLVNLGTTFNQLYGGDDARVEQAVTEALGALSSRGWTITLASAWKPDDPILERIAGAVGIEEVLYWHDEFARALADIGRFELVLAEKLHVAVIAACRGVPFVALNYRSKVLDFCESLGWEHWCPSTENLGAATLVDRIEELARERTHFANQLASSVREARLRLEDAAACAGRILAEAVRAGVSR